MRIGIDVDGVLRDFISPFKKVVGQEHPDVVFPEIISSWKFENDITGLTRDELKEIYKHKFSNVFEEGFSFSRSSSALFGHLKNGQNKTDTS